MKPIEYTEADRQRLLSFLSGFIAEGTFFRCDLEYLGAVSDYHRFLGLEFENRNIALLVLNFRDALLLLGSHQGQIQMRDATIEYIASANAQWLSGPQDTLTGLLGNAEIDASALFACEHLMKFGGTYSSMDIATTWKVVETEDAELSCVYDFLITVPDFAAFPPLEDFRRDIRLGMRRVFHVSKNSSIVGSASIIGNNSRSGMIAAVCTRPDFRNRGIGKAMVTTLTQILCNEEKAPCLLQQFDPAGGLYAKCGYSNLGKWCYCEVPKFKKAITAVG